MSRSAPLTLADLSLLAAAQVAAEREVDNAKGVLGEKAKTLMRLREESVPMAMAELEMDRVRLSTGEEVSVKQEVYCAISEANKDEAHDWLEEHNFGGLIKTTVSVSFGKDEMPFALALFEKLQSMKVEATISTPTPPKRVGKKMVRQPPKYKKVKRELEPQMDRGVHPQTLKAFLREQLSKSGGSDELPLELFGARPVWVSKITPPKEATTK